MSLNKDKCDPILGLEINTYLTKQGVNTPIIENNANQLTGPEKIARIQNDFANIMRVLGLDINDDSLMETPKRVAKMFVNEIFWGLDSENFPKITTVENKMKYDEMIIEKDITIKSNCEHHFVPILGSCHIAYIPNKKVIGLSKLNRIAEYFSRRPQIQERLTEQIFYALKYILATEDIAVIIDARHLCVQSRGVEDINSSTITSKMGGKFKTNIEARQEILTLLKG